MKFFLKMHIIMTFLFLFLHCRSTNSSTNSMSLKPDFKFNYINVFVFWQSITSYMLIWTKNIYNFQSGIQNRRDITFVLSTDFWSQMKCFATIKSENSLEVAVAVTQFFFYLKEMGNII